MAIKTIDEVIQKLDEIIQISISSQSRMGFFAALYKRMTIAVKLGIESGAFENSARMEMLDIIFANRYLNAYDAYNAGQPLSACWSKAFDASKNNSLTVLEHLILGVNAHINLDLGIAAATTMQGQPIETIRHDFDKINEVIGSLVNEVQDELSAISFPMKFIDNVFNNRDESVINFSVNLARKQAWLLANSLSILSDANDSVAIQRTDNTIAFLADKIISPGIWMSFLLKLVKLMEWNDSGKIIATLNRTSKS